MGGGRTPVALAIAGSDSGGGAGIQADLKAFARCGVHGTCAITAITVQNTLAVSAVHTVPPEVVIGQVRAVVGDLGVDAVKVGMLGSAQTALAVAEALKAIPAEVPVVVDPVMVAESGARLLEDDARRVLVREILPRAWVATPNLPEALALTGDTAAVDGDLDGFDAESLAASVLALGPRAVVVTGGHRRHATDVYHDASGTHFIDGPRHLEGAAHGSGCTHSSVLAACLARGLAPVEAARVARRLAGEAVANGLRELGGGAGPVDVLGLQRFRLT